MGVQEISVEVVWVLRAVGIGVTKLKLVQTSPAELNIYSFKWQAGCAKRRCWMLETRACAMRDFQ